MAKNLDTYPNIPAKELRIGNYVYIVGESSPYKWTIGDFDIHFEAEEETPIHPRAIPLTPEILEKCGFRRWGTGDKKYPGEVFYHKDPMLTDRLMWSAYEKRVCFCTDTYEELGHRVFYRPVIYYLHQLQNAFFAFYSQELEIQL